MPAVVPLNLSALSEHQRVLWMWLSFVFAGVLAFAGLIVLSHFVLYAPGIIHDTVKYKRAEAVLGFGDVGALAFSAIALLQFINVMSKYHDRVFRQFVADNHWKVEEQFDVNKIPSVLLSAGENYEQFFGFSGKYAGHNFSGLIFEYDAPNTKTRRYICFHFTLPKPYPMVVIDNRRNDQSYLLRESNLPDRIPNGVEVTLEGYFNRYFRVSTSKGYEQEMLEILTPEFMAALEDRVSDKVDIEISNRNLFLIYEADYYSERSVASIFSTADVVLNKLGKLSKSWLASSKSQERAIAESAENARRRLFLKSDWVSGLLTIVFFILFMIFVVARSNN